MIKINLLPFRKAQRLENIRMQISIFCLAIFFVVAVLGFSYAKIDGELTSTQEKNAKLKKEYKSYAGMLKRIKKLKAKRKDLQRKLNVIRGLERKKAGPVQLFDEICMAVPEGKVFLRSMSESGDRVVMSGVAIDYDTVAQFMINLEKTKTIQTVKLGSTTQTKSKSKKGLSTCTFNLSCMKYKKQNKKGKNKKGRRR